MEVKINIGYKIVTSEGLPIVKKETVNEVSTSLINGGKDYLQRVLQDALNENPDLISKLVIMVDTATESGHINEFANATAYTCIATIYECLKKEAIRNTELNYEIK